MVILNKINTFYDESVDILYISFGKPKKAICYELENGELIRLDPFTNEIVGITILDIEERFNKPYISIEPNVKSIVNTIIERYNREIILKNSKK